MDCNEEWGGWVGVVGWRIGGSKIIIAAYYIKVKYKQPDP